MGEILFLCLQNCIIFSKLHNFLISERLLMYLQQWRRRWEIKCITLYFYGRAPFLLPLGRAVRENRSRNPYFSFLEIKKSIFLISVSCLVWLQLSILFRIAIDQVKILTSGSTRNSREKTDQEKLGKSGAKSLFPSFHSYKPEGQEGWGLEENELSLACFGNYRQSIAGVFP